MLDIKYIREDSAEFVARPLIKGKDPRDHQAHRGMIRT